MTAGGETGWMVEKTHHYPLRVYYADTDAAGLVYHAVYLAYAERARTEMMRLAGLDHVRLRDEIGLMLAVKSCEIDYLRPARLDDRLEVQSALVRLAGASMHLRQVVWRGDEELTRMHIRLVCITIDGRAARIPEILRPICLGVLTVEAQ